MAKATNRYDNPGERVSTWSRWRDH